MIIAFVALYRSTIFNAVTFAYVEFFTGKLCIGSKYDNNNNINNNNILLKMRLGRRYICCYHSIFVLCLINDKDNKD